MPNTTTHYGFFLPLVNDPTDQDLWGGYLNTNTNSYDAMFYTINTNITALQAAITGLVGIPTGGMCDYMGTTLPAGGFLECDGSNVSRTTYANLFAAIGTTYGTGDGSTTFGLPLMARRTSVGRGGTATATLGNAIGNTGGSEGTVMGANNLITHTHGLQRNTSNDCASSGFGGDEPLIKNGTATTNNFGTTQAAGSATPDALNVIQPSIVVMKIIKT